MCSRNNAATGLRPTPWRGRGAAAVGSDSEMTDRLEAALSDAVAARMVADVPVGAFLSGGIDSSTVVALMQQHASVPVRTFTVGFADRSFDESGEAAAVAAHLGTDHTAVHVGDAEAVEVIAQLPDIWDEPFADVSQIPTYLVSRVARREVTVSLSGDGGDELFAGYNRHAWLDRVWGRAAAMPPGVRRTAGSALGRIPPALVERAARATTVLPVGWQVRNPSTKVAKLARVLAASDPEDAYRALTTHWDRCGDGGARGSTIRTHRATATVHPCPTSGITEQMLWFDLVGYLPDDILAKLDRAAMAVSLETRVPFLDRRILDLAWRLPLDAKLRGRKDEVGAAPGARAPRAGSAGRATEDGLRPAHRIVVPRRAGPLGRASPGRATSAVPRGCWTRSRFAGPGISIARADGIWATSCGTCWSCRHGSTGGRHAWARRLGLAAPASGAPGDE